VIESTSLGAAYLAGLGGGVWRDSEELLKLKTGEREFHPSMDKSRRRDLLEGWRKALRQAMVK
jgi:glycerol kinase